MRALAAAVCMCVCATLQTPDAAVQIYPPTAARVPTLVQLPVGGNLQAALDGAQPGDVIELPSGATFTGNFILPVKNGTSYITIRTAAVDGQPAADERIRPEHSALLARIQSPTNLPALRTAPGAHHWRL